MRATVGDVHRMRSDAIRYISAFVRRIVRACDTARDLRAIYNRESHTAVHVGKIVTWSRHRSLHRTFAGVLRDDTKFSHVAGANTFRLNTSSIRTALLRVRS